MSKRPVISSLWIGGPLSYLELLSLKSMMDRGHIVKLYHYLPIDNAPSWLFTCDANEIMPLSHERLDSFENSLTIIANMFRYHLLAKTNEVWCDCDVFFLRPLPDLPTILVVEKARPIRFWNNSLLRLPQDSPVLKDLLEFVSTDTPILPNSPYFFDERKATKEDLETLGGNGNVHFRDLPWGSSGPRALSYFLTKHGMRQVGFPNFYHQPIQEMRNLLLARNVPGKRIMIPLPCQSIHFFGSRMRSELIRISLFRNNLPQPGSFLDSRMRELDIDPRDAPLVWSIGKKEHLEARRTKLEAMRAQGTEHG